MFSKFSGFQVSSLGTKATIGPMVIGALATAGVLAPGLGQPSARAAFVSGIVDLQFVSNAGTSPGPTASGPAVIGSGNDVWNQIIGISGSNNFNPLTDQALNLTNGNSSDATISVDGTSPNPAPANYSDPYIVSYGGDVAANTSLLGSEVVNYASAGAYSFVATIGGLDPNMQYNLYLYNPLRDTAYSVAGASTVTGTITPTSNAGWSSGANYLEFTLNPESSADSNPGTITISMAGESGTNSSASLSGFQITPVPEPAALGLMAAFGLGILLLGKRRKMV